MDEIRIMRNLMKSIEKEYGISECNILVEVLLRAGITEINSDIKDKIAYLQEICTSISLNNYWDAVLISSESITELKERYAQVVFYTEKEKCEVNNLLFSCADINEFRDYFIELGFNESQQKETICKIIKMGGFAKHIDEAKEAINLLECFEISDNIRNEFICENADCILNDYARKLNEIFSTLCEKFGKKEAFLYLCQNPLIMVDYKPGKNLDFLL